MKLHKIALVALSTALFGCAGTQTKPMIYVNNSPVLYKTHVDTHHFACNTPFGECFPDSVRTNITICSTDNPEICKTVKNVVVSTEFSGLFLTKEDMTGINYTFVKNGNKKIEERSEAPAGFDSDLNGQVINVGFKNGELEKIIPAVRLSKSDLPEVSVLGIGLNSNQEQEFFTKKYVFGGVTKNVYTPFSITVTSSPADTSIPGMQVAEPNIPSPKTLSVKWEGPKYVKQYSDYKKVKLPVSFGLVNPLVALGISKYEIVVPGKPSIFASERPGYIEIAQDMPKHVKVSQKAKIFNLSGNTYDIPGYVQTNACNDCLDFVTVKNVGLEDMYSYTFFVDNSKNIVISKNLAYGIVKFDEGVEKGQEEAALKGSKIPESTVNITTSPEKPNNFIAPEF